MAVERPMQPGGDRPVQVSGPGTPCRRVDWARLVAGDPAARLDYEWLVTNGLGGVASGTVVGAVTRQHHGLLVAALPAPHGRSVMLSYLDEQLRLPDGAVFKIGGQPLTHQTNGAPDQPAPLDSVDTHLVEFRLEFGLPIWHYAVQGCVLEKRVIMPHGQNTVHITYRLLSGLGPVRLQLRPIMGFRPHDHAVSTPLSAPYTVTATGRQYEIAGPPDLPPLRLHIHGERARLTLDGGHTQLHHYPIEESRGYAAEGALWAPGHVAADLTTDRPVTLVASTEPWDVLEAISPDEVARGERERRERLLHAAPECARTGSAAEMVLAADQFVITPVGRAGDLTRARAAGAGVRTVIAGYPWFTDWGRDTMISLEGLTLTTGREAEAAAILRLFARHVRDGLIPNLFPEGEDEGLYHTADATLWYFQAIRRYLDVTDDRELLYELLPTLLAIVEHHLQGTRFGIGVDPADGLLRQGAEGYQLTWMDAKVDDWVVTPRRGKAVEINALWYNALRLLAGWSREEGREADARRLTTLADQAGTSFNARFWYEPGGYLYDVIDGEQGDDPACRPNQLFAISLTHPVLAEERWQPVVGVVKEQLLTPVGLRSLAPGHPDYQPRYAGHLRARDAAYHQGTVWAWLVGPFVDAWLKAYPDDLRGAREALVGIETHLSEACLGTISEIFDAEPPHTPRGCFAQAWSVAEMLRALAKTC